MQFKKFITGFVHSDLTQSVRHVILRDGATYPSILSLLNASLAALKRHEDEINRLNVYPVPDGDTGTNMVHTMQTILAEASKADETRLDAVLKAISYGALMGARGNSGVILSQIVRGFCEEVGKADKVTTKTLAAGLRSSTTVAYGAVKKPTEGTMLTVIKDMAKAAESLPRNKKKPAELLERVVVEGRKSVERTPALLPILKESGVVDAGGYGLVVIAQGMLAALKGDPIDGAVSLGDMVDVHIVEEDIEHAYCTELLLKSGGIDMKALEVKLDQMGDSMLVVGTPELTKIHIHTNEPGKVLQVATDLGTISEVQINNILEQSEQRAQGIRSEAAPEETALGVIAVASGNGVKEILESMGVDRVVSGGQSMNPSTADILSAVDSIPAKSVIVLPNNKNIILAAQQAAELTHKTVSVIPTTSIPEAFTALVELDKDAALEENVEAMGKAFYRVKTGEITYAVRDGKGEGGKFKRNDYIGLYDGQIKTTGKHLLSTTLNLIEHMLEDSDEVVTVLVGDQARDNEVKELTEVLTDRHPDLELDIHKGDQPIYHFIIGIE